MIHRCNSVIWTCETFVKISQTKLNISVLRMCSWHQKYMHDVLINIPSVGHFLKSHFMHVFLIIRCNNYHLPTSVKYKNGISQETAFSKQCDNRRIFLHRLHVCNNKNVIINRKVYLCNNVIVCGFQRQTLPSVPFRPKASVTQLVPESLSRLWHSQIRTHQSKTG